MKFSVKNLGPIEEGTISFDKPLTVLVGPNSSGKSYVSYLVYGVLKDLYSMVENSLLEIGSSEIDIYNNSNKSNKDFLLDINRKLKTKVKENFKKYYNSEITHIDIDILLGDELNFLLEYTNEEKIAAVLNRSLHGDPTRIVKKLQEISISKGEAAFIGGMGLLLLLILIIGWSTNDKKLVKSQGKSKKIINNIPRIFFFPAQRLGLDNMVAILTDLPNFSWQTFMDSERKDLKYQSGVFDYMKMIKNLKNKDKVKTSSNFVDFANEIEKTLLKGKVKLENGCFMYKPLDKDVKIERHMTSSLVKSISGLVLYFRYYARQGDTIIIDEPEVNLHPDNQRIIARILAKAVKLGFRLIVSTHSDYIIRELNNLILLDSIYEDAASQEEILKEYRGKGYDESTRLNKDDLGVYYFIDNTIKALPVNQYGFEVSSIDNEVYKLNEATDDFYAKLRELEA